MPFPEYTSVDQAEYLKLILPSITPDIGPITQVQWELEANLTAIQVEVARWQGSVLCAGHNQPGAPIPYGCTVIATHMGWAIPWVQLRREGIPSRYRAVHDMLIPLCKSCLILLESKRRKRKTAWINLVANDYHVSKSKARLKYEGAYDAITYNTSAYLAKANAFRDTFMTSVTHYTLAIGDQMPVMPGELINVDYSLTKKEGVVTLSVYNPT